MQWEVWVRVIAEWGHDPQLFLGTLPIDGRLPWDHLDSGLDKEWLWQDWQDALDEVEVEDCRWSPCFDCGVCDQMGTEIQVGPTDGVILPIVQVTS